MCDCKKIKALFEGSRVEDIPQLKNILVELNTNYKTWETIYECTQCGQKWLEKYEQEGHGEVPSVRKI